MKAEIFFNFSNQKYKNDSSILGVIYENFQAGFVNSYNYENILFCMCVCVCVLNCSSILSLVALFYVCFLRIMNMNLNKNQ